MKFTEVWFFFSLRINYYCCKFLTKCVFQFQHGFFRGIMLRFCSSHDSVLFALPWGPEQINKMLFYAPVGTKKCEQVHTYVQLLYPYTVTWKSFGRFLCMWLMKLMYCKALGEIKFFKIEGIGPKFRHIQ